MASTHQSPVMVDASPPSHPFTSPDYALSILSPSASNRSSSSESPNVNMSDVSREAVNPTQPPAGVSVPSEHQDNQAQAALEQATNDADDSSNSESSSDSSTSTETPGTSSTPRSSAQDSSHPIPESSTTPLDSNSAEQPPVAPSTDAEARPSSGPVVDEVGEDQTPPENAAVPPPPADLNIQVIDNTPSWVLYEEDKSVPSESELKEIEANKNELSAADSRAVEKHVFEEWDDPDQRPCKKIRLSWVIKGVRGTREKPNRARIMTSPAALVDGKYWNIKFFPRGNKSRTSMAVFLRCSPIPPETQKDTLEGSFRCYHGDPDANLSETEPSMDLDLRVPEPKQPESEPQAEEAVDPSNEQSSQGRHDEEGDDSDSVSDEDDDDDLPRTPTEVQVVKADNFRVSAQLGLVVYNPSEPRTCYTSSSSHQFYPHQDDWGWDNAVSQWEDIHTRKHGQRQALLRNDTLAIDAYIRIFDDPTQALFWHPSEGPGESQWDAKGLIGLFPFGTERLHHSPATAGIAAWALLAPFRDCIQRIEAGAWRKDSSVRPRPLIAQLQLMLFQMRHMKKDELYIHLDRIIDELRSTGESFDNVTNFWDTFRRSIEIEAAEDGNVESALKSIFGTRQQLRALPKLPVHNVKDFQEAAEKAFDHIGFMGSLPNFLPLTFDRQSFDSEKRQWRLHHDRVRISEVLDMSRFCTDEDAKYVLYGLVIHNGVHSSDLGGRTSGRFFSVLRPTGPGGKWLAFSDGHGNKIFSLTKKAVQAYEGLEGDDLKRFSSERETIHTALYIRSSCVPGYLSDKLEPYQLPLWLKPHLAEAYDHTTDDFVKTDDDDKDKPVSIELFWDKSVAGQAGKLDLYKLKTNAAARRPEYRQTFTADSNATILDVKNSIASILQIDKAAFKLWAMNYVYLGHVSKSCMTVLPNESVVSLCLGTSKYLSLWLSLVPETYDLAEDVLISHSVKINGIHVEAPPRPEPVVEDKVKTPTQDAPTDGVVNPVSLDDDAAGAETSTEAAADAEQASVREAVNQSLRLSPAQLANAAQDDQPSSSVANDSHPDQNLAASDAEQAAVENAVARDVQAIPPPAGTATTLVTEVEPIDAASQQQSTVSSTPATAAEPAETQEATTATSAEAPQGRDQPESGNVAEPAQSLPQDQGQASATPTLTPLEPENNEVAEPETSNAEASDPNALPHVDIIVPSGDDALLSHGEPSLPNGVPIAIGNDRIILVQAQGDEISAEDAALIQSMITADLEAAERERQARAADAEAGSDTGDEVIESRPTTPRQRVNDVYGFLHVFDAENQTVTAHSTFLVAEDTVISAMVRKQLGYGEDKAFHLWKRIGTYRTAGVSLESTFQDLSFQHCREIIVGDHLGELKIERLKSEAKYVDPGQLMRYMAMVERGHPVAGLSSEDPVEIADFGGDYYKGPLVRGQRHGKVCSVITRSGDQYEGPLVAGHKSGGKGKMIYQNGDVYDGEWLDDQKHGQGEFVEKRTGNRYVGGYENDKRWGKGITYWEQADQQAALCQVCYYEEVDALFYRCGHVVACYTCARQCAADSNQCPVCRKPIDNVVKMYRS